MAISTKSVQIFNLLKSGGGFTNPLEAVSQASSLGIASSVTHLTTFQNASSSVKATLTQAGLTASILSEAQILMSSATTSVTSLVSYADTSVKAFSARIALADHYVKAMNKFGYDEGCTPYNSVLSVATSTGHTVLNGIDSALQTANSAMEELSSAIDAVSSEIASIAASVTAEIAKLTTLVEGYIQDALDYIAEEASLLEEYIKTSAQAFMAEFFPDWFSDECKSTVTTAVASDELKTIVNS